MAHVSATKSMLICLETNKLRFLLLLAILTNVNFVVRQNIIEKFNRRTKKSFWSMDFREREKKQTL